jgi:hypothetical protein
MEVTPFQYSKPQNEKNRKKFHEEKSHLQVQRLLLHLQELEQKADTGAPDSEQYDNARQGLHACVSVVQLLLQATTPNVPQLLTDIVLELHDHALLNLFRSPSIQEAVSRLCIAYYLADAPDAAQVSPQMVCPVTCSLA